MRLRIVLAMGFLALSCSCTDDSGRAEAMTTLAAFQDALHRGDEAACRELLTLESRVALAEMPWERIRGKQRLVVVGAEGSGAEYLVQVQDPNDGGRRAEFVVVREYGRLVVDLVASAGLTAEFVEATGSRAEEFVPRELTPADHDRIRQHELAQPPR